MANEQKPIKRGTQLAPLSREHHEGLLFVWKLRQGIAKNIEPARLTAFAQWFWTQHLQPHFQKEEAALPLVLSHTHPLLQQMFREHAEVKKWLDDVMQYGDLKKLEALAQLVNDHIRFEERQLFNEVERTATPQQLQQLSELLHDDVPSDVWEDAFWNRT